jgi:type III pantothenate kinase
MARLAIDIGNTRTKIAVFDGDALVNVNHLTQVDDLTLQSLFNSYPVTAAILSTVKSDDEPWINRLEGHTRVVRFNRSMAYGIHNHYGTPQTLGLDRLAAVTGARWLYPNQKSLIIDAGTCITYDAVDEAGNYYGGSISPGLQMRYNALPYYTAVLPLVTADVNFNSRYGHNTITAIQSGVQNGLRYEVEGFIQSYCQQQQQLNIILTGGDSDFLDTVLKNSIFAGYIKTEPHLVLKGLNAAIQKHND